MRWRGTPPCPQIKGGGTPRPLTRAIGLGGLLVGELVVLAWHFESAPLKQSSYRFVAFLGEEGVVPLEVAIAAATALLASAGNRSALRLPVGDEPERQMRDRYRRQVGREHLAYRVRPRLRGLIVGIAAEEGDDGVIHRVPEVLQDPSRGVYMARAIDPRWPSPLSPGRAAAVAVCSRQ
jgi:hypothetical protein